MNFVFQHAFYCHVYHRSLRFISYQSYDGQRKRVFMMMMMIFLLSLFLDIFISKEIEKNVVVLMIDFNLSEKHTLGANIDRKKKTKTVTFHL